MISFIEQDDDELVITGTVSIVFVDMSLSADVLRGSNHSATYSVRISLHTYLSEEYRFNIMQIKFCTV
jgi:hypothetical protein